jgi:hypothetical protein
VVAAPESEVTDTVPQLTVRPAGPLAGNHGDVVSAPREFEGQLVRQIIPILRPRVKLLEEKAAQSDAAKDVLENKALTEELSQYKETEPPSSAGRTSNSAIPPGPGSAKASLFQELRKKAH